MIISVLNKWNPWWEKKELIHELEGKHRPCYDDLVNSIEIREITIITGVRRSGKSTLMYQMVEHLLKKGIQPEQILFVNLEDKKLSSAGDIKSCPVYTARIFYYSHPCSSVLSNCCCLYNTSKNV